MYKTTGLLIAVACLVCLSSTTLLAAETGGMPVKPPPAHPTPPLPGFAIESATAFDEYLQTDIPPADGFDFPVGNPDGWGSYEDVHTGRQRTGWGVFIRFGQRYSYGIHPGEDWNGAGLGNSDQDQAVYSVAAGQVVFAEQVKPAGGVVLVQHVFYENHVKKRIRSVYKHLVALQVKAGDRIERRQVLGYIGRGTDDRYLAHLHLELRWDETLGPTYWPSARNKSLAWIQEHFAPPSAFIRSHRQLFVPQSEDSLVLVHPESQKVRLYRQGRLAAEAPIGYGRASRRSQRASVDRSPRGMYFVVDRRPELIGGDFSKRGPGYALRINYPNKFDAHRGRSLGLMAPQHESRIASAWHQRRPTLETTLLNRGLGFKGWIREWDDQAEHHRYWGSLLMRGPDMHRLFDRLEPGAMVVIF